MNTQAKHNAPQEEAELSDWLCDLMDGELAAAQRTDAVMDLCRDAQARERWAMYHLVGDALRDTAVLSPGFNEKLSARLAQEPTVLAPRIRRYGAPAAMALAASVAVISVIALMPGLSGQQDGLQLSASARETIHNAALVKNMETQMAPYLVAHQEFAQVAVASPYQSAVMTVAATQDELPK